MKTQKTRLQALEIQSEGLHLPDEHMLKILATIGGPIEANLSEADLSARIEELERTPMGASYRPPSWWPGPFEIQEGSTPDSVREDELARTKVSLWTRNRERIEDEFYAAIETAPVGQLRARLEWCEAQPWDATASLPPWWKGPRVNLGMNTGGYSLREVRKIREVLSGCTV